MQEADMDQSSRPHSTKVHPLHSPRMDQDYRGGAIRRSVDKKPVYPSPRISTPSVDYDDVFGGPPRLVASLLASSSSSSSSSSLPPPSPSLNAEKTILSKVPSFRSSRVFELPVFGDDVIPGTYEASKTSSSPPVFVYEDIFKENRQVSDVVAGPSSYGNPNSDANSRSRPSSRPGSRRMSPVHPSLATGSEPTHEEASYVKSSLASFTKSRSGGGKVTSKSSFASFSSIDDSRERGLDIPSVLPRSALTSASVPPSPSPQHPLSQFKISAKSSSNNNGPITGIEIDDVFGGFPQKSLLQQRSHNGRDAFRIKSEKKYPNEMFQSDNVVKTPDGFARKNRAISRSFSSTEDQALHEDLIEIRMHRDGKSRGPERIGKEWITVNDLHQSTKLSQPDNVSQLQFKSWKDWTSDLPANQSTNSINELVSGKMEAFSRVSSEKRRGVEAKYDRNMAEKPISKKADDSLTLKQYHDKISTSLSPISAEETVEMEERELQALLASAWKLNEEREKRKEQSRISRERPNVVELEGQELQPKDNRQFKESQSQKIKMDTKNDRFLKRHSHQDKEGVKIADTLTSSDTVEPSFNNNKVPVENLAQVFVKSDSVVEEDFTVVFEETPTELSSEIIADVGFDGRKQSTTDLQTSIDLDGAVNADKCTESDELQDVVQFKEEFDISPGEEIEDIECFLGLVSSLDGFQEIEGESLERRKTRLERHVRTKERAAKAVEEMQQREAELQREQEEKQQLAESSDRKIKQWAAGKEGNLRALLSNLQYVLWPDSGWTTLPLTSLIEGSDVKKAYRKATLFIHPDKLQQKSATLQQKYIAGRVFDILQEAWKTFNTQELF